MKRTLRIILPISTILALVFSVQAEALSYDELKKCTSSIRSSWSAARVQIDTQACGVPAERLPSQTFQLPAAASRQTSNLYVGMGDSVAAGIGLLPVTNGDECGVSSQSYVTKVAAEIQRTYLNLACSGATAGDLVTKQRQTGREAQITNAFAHGIPSVITISAGANDVQWDYFLRKCYFTRCGTATDRTLTQSFIIAMKVKMNYALNLIDWRSGENNPQVILTGYYLPLSNNCSAVTPRITASEITWMNQQVGLINKALKETAQNYNFVEFAPVSFAGHELCTDDPWIQGINDRAPFHPNTKGQQAIAKSATILID